MVDGLHRQLDLLDIRLQHRSQDLSLTDPAVGHLHTLDRIELRAHQFAKRLLESRVSVISKSHGKPDHR